jgi:hypothetical protein
MGIPTVRMTSCYVAQVVIWVWEMKTHFKAHDRMWGYAQTDS